MLQGAIEDIGDDLHVAVRMCGEPTARRDAIVVDHAKRPEAHVIGIVVVAERKAVLALEPAEIGFAAVFGFSHVTCIVVVLSGRSLFVRSRWRAWMESDLSTSVFRLSANVFRANHINLYDSPDCFQNGYNRHGQARSDECLRESGCARQLRRGRRARSG